MASCVINRHDAHGKSHAFTVIIITVSTHTTHQLSIRIVVIACVHSYVFLFFFRNYKTKFLSATFRNRVKIYKARFIFNRSNNNMQLRQKNKKIKPNKLYSKKQNKCSIYIIYIYVFDIYPGQINSLEFIDLVRFDRVL